MSRTLEQAEKRAKYFGGHEFDYESVSDLFKCCFCGVYEVVARKNATEDAPITLCPGLACWEGETERRYFQVRWPGTTSLDFDRMRALDDQVHGVVRATGVVRSIPYSRRLDATTTSIYETTPAHIENVLSKFGGLFEVDQLAIEDVDRIIAAFVDDRNARDGEARGYIADLRAKQPVA